MRKPIEPCPPLECEENIRREFTKREKEQADVYCTPCRHGRILLRVNGVAYFHHATDDLGGMVPCKARAVYQEAVRSHA
jgi:hypothetical protein